jgi:NTP pyrophosphatase (non-canonical NTP hydrolase)
MSAGLDAEQIEMWNYWSPSEVKMKDLNSYAKECHDASASNGWWNCPHTGEDLLSNPSYAPYVIATKIALIHSETSEMLEGHRRTAKDDKLTHRDAAEVEAVDVLIRIFDLAGKMGWDLQGAYNEKMVFNDNRPDHKVAQRKAGGKLY